MFRFWCLDQGKICQSVISLLAYYFVLIQTIVDIIQHDALRAIEACIAGVRAWMVTNRLKKSDDLWYQKEVSHCGLLATILKKAELESVTVGESEIIMQIPSVPILGHELIGISPWAFSKAFRASQSIFHLTDHPGVMLPIPDTHLCDISSRLLQLLTLWHMVENQQGVQWRADPGGGSGRSWSPLSYLTLVWDWNPCIYRIVYHFLTGWFFNEARVAFCP